MLFRQERKISQPSHRKRLKTAENKGFLTFLNAMGRSVPLKTPIRFQIANKINGFVHVSYGTALEKIDKYWQWPRLPTVELQGLCRTAGRAICFRFRKYYF
jgi:hypothetical protein